MEDDQVARVKMEKFKLVPCLHVVITCHGVYKLRALTSAVCPRFVIKIEFSQNTSFPRMLPRMDSQVIETSDSKTIKRVVFDFLKAEKRVKKLEEEFRIIKRRGYIAEDRLTDALDAGKIIFSCWEDDGNYQFITRDKSHRVTNFVGNFNDEGETNKIVYSMWHNEQEKLAKADELELATLMMDAAREDMQFYAKEIELIENLA